MDKSLIDQVRETLIDAGYSWYGDKDTGSGFELYSSPDSVIVLYVGLVDVHERESILEQYKQTLAEFAVEVRFPVLLVQRKS